jgi:glycine/serine hydroxymethyltransferase
VRKTALLSVLALGLAGCAGAASDSAKEFKGEQAKVAAVIEQIEKAARDDKPDVVCERLLTDARLKLVDTLGTTCKTGVKDAFKDADSFDITVDKITIKGDAATVNVTSGRGSNKKSDTLQLKRDGTAWKVDSLSS